MFPVKPGERSSRVFSWLIYENDKLSHHATFVLNSVVSTISRSYHRDNFGGSNFPRSEREDRTFRIYVSLEVNMRVDVRRKG